MHILREMKSYPDKGGVIHRYLISYPQVGVKSPQNNLLGCRFSALPMSDRAITSFHILGEHLDAEPGLRFATAKTRIIAGEAQEGAVMMGFLAWLFQPG